MQRFFSSPIEPTPITLQDALQLVEKETIEPDFSLIQNFCPVIKLENKPVHLRIEVREWDDMKAVTLQDLCRFSKHNSYAAISILQCLMIDRIVVFSSESLEPMPKTFINNCTFEQINELAHSRFISALFLIPNINIDLSDRVVRDYAHSLAIEYTTMPDILLDSSIEFKEAIAASHYSKQGEVEGYWREWEKSDSISYQSIVSLNQKSDASSMNLDEKQLHTLREIIFRNKKPTEENRFPIPETKPWQHKEKFLVCIEALEAIALYEELMPTKKNILSKILNKSSMSNLIHLMISYCYYKGYSSSRLPLKGREHAGDSEYSITFQDEKGAAVNLKWTQGLKWYVRDYNVIPSKEFLMNFQKYLKMCQTRYLQNANKIADQLKSDGPPSKSKKTMCLIL